MDVVTWRRDLRGRSLTLLQSLGSDADEVGRRLGAAAVRGDPGDPERCAVAVFLAPILSADPVVRGVRVTARCARISVRRGARFSVGVRLPEPVRSFVDGFDRGHFPELVVPLGHRPLPASAPERAPRAPATPPTE